MKKTRGGLRKPSKENIIVAGMNALCVILFVCALIVKSSLISPLFTQKMAERWSSDETRHAQISCFFSEKARLNEDGLRTLRRNIEKKLSDASITAPSENARLYADCFSLSEKLTAESDRASGSYTVFVAGGDYFMFHPLELKSGYYFSPGDIMQDRIILDEDAAWQLFGSNDVAGKTVHISGKPFVVAAVIARESDTASQMAYNSGPAVYISYETYSLMYTSAPISAYEIVLPNPIDGFARDAVTKSVSANELDFELVENTSRFGFASLMQVLGALGERSMRTKAVTFPYWENAARLVEERAALLTLVMLLLPILPAVTLTVIGAKLWKRRRWRLSDVREFYEAKREERWIRQREEPEKVKKKTRKISIFKRGKKK